MLHRRLRALTLLGIVCVLLGCASAPEATPPQRSAATDSTMIGSPQGTLRRVLHILGAALTYPGEDAAMHKTIAAFEQTCDCTVDARFEGQWTEVPQRLQAARIAHEPVDIIPTGANLVNSTLARSAALMDLTKLVTPFQERFRPGMLEPYTIGGHLWAIPYSQVSTSAIFYNQDLFRELGLDAPKTYQDLVRVAAVIHKQKQIIPMIHQGKAAWMWPMWFFETYAQTSGNHSVALVQAFLRGERKFTKMCCVIVGLGVLIRGWLSDPQLALWSIMVVDIWKWTGFHMLLFLAGLQSIPHDLYEAARMDGATGRQRFVRITLPLLRQTTAVSVTLAFVGWLASNYDVVYVMTGGGPYHATEVASTWIATTAFRFGSPFYTWWGSGSSRVVWSRAPCRGSWALLKELEVAGGANRLCPALYAKLTKEVIDVPLDRANRDDQLLGNLAIRGAVGDQA
jgi:hypothetical protein